MYRSGDQLVEVTLHRYTTTHFKAIVRRVLPATSRWDAKVFFDDGSRYDNSVIDDHTFEYTASNYDGFRGSQLERVGTQNTVVLKLVGCGRRMSPQRQLAGKTRNVARDRTAPRRQREEHHARLERPGKRARGPWWGRM